MDFEVHTQNRQKNIKNYFGRKKGLVGSKVVFDLPGYKPEAYLREAYLHDVVTVLKRMGPPYEEVLEIAQHTSTPPKKMVHLGACCALILGQIRSNVMPGTSCLVCGKPFEMNESSYL
eukprot:GHVU01086019.1.p2 GENE.GHVU01086019.1~~GHVU01086019.1.p2  ORF type:complete len:118 (-),score=12.16 GHVU01086019.1:432-785(-)